MKNFIFPFNSRNLFFRALFFLIVLGALSACGTADRSKYAAFAEAGMAYSRALIAVTDRAGVAAIDSDDVILIQDHEAHTGNDASAQRLMVITNKDQELEKTLRLYSKTKKILVAFNGYFSALNDVAKSDAPEKFGGAFNSAASQFLGLYNGISGNSISLPTGTDSILSGLAVRNVERALKKRLENDKDFLNSVFDYLDFLFSDEQESIKTRLIADLESANTMQYEWDVFRVYQADGFADSRKIQKAWSNTRKKLLLADMQIAELETAKKASKKLQKLFNDLLEDNSSVSFAEIERLYNELNALNKFLRDF